MGQGIVKAICTSKKKGMQKKYVQSATFIENHGIEGDGHAGDWDRQVSLLAAEVIADFNAKGAAVHDGAFGENLIIEGFDLINLPVGTELRCNDVKLKLTKIGKECHTKCHIYHRMGDCIMPRNGVFSIVTEGGTINVGDPITY